MNIVILDGYTINPGDNPWNEIETLGRLKIYDRTEPEHLVERAGEAQILLVNKCPLDAESIRKLTNLEFISVTATGFNCVDIEAAGREGIPVSNLPIYGTNSVAQYVIALLLEHCHHVGIHDAAVKAGEWSASLYWSFWKTPQVELYGKTMGIVGFGRIGRRVGELAHALGMDVVAYDVFPGPHPGYEPFSWVGIEEAFSKADFVSLHAPLTKDNKRFVDNALLARMKPTAVLINAARGELVNPDDLAQALNNGEIACAALDVAEVEPIPADNPLLRARNTIMTPHMAWASLEARRRMVHITAENIRAFIAKDPQNVVNKTFLETRNR
jgi:glycerate dehydrogenase